MPSPMTGSDPLRPSLNKIEDPAKKPGFVTIDIAYEDSLQPTNASACDEKVIDIPDKQGSKLHRLLSDRLLSVYKLIFSLAFISNSAVLIGLLVKSSPSHYIKISNAAIAVSANLAVSILIRQEHVINMLFWLFCSVPLSAPLRIRRVAAKIYHLGGLHSGCALAAFLWFILFAGMLTRQFAVDVSEPEIVRAPAVLVLTYTILTLLVTIIMLTIPRFRSKYHNSFEAVHRFGGWSILALFWVNLVLLADAGRKLKPGGSLAKAVRADPSFWLLLIITLSIIYPWLHLRKVKVDTVVLSDHAARMDFTYHTAGIGHSIRISDRPLKEWHSFAAFSKPDRHGFSIVVSNAGDWTKHQISHPPSRIWVRGVPASGVLRVATLFRRIVLVATGSGIGPCLSVLYSAKVPCRVLWSTPHPSETYGDEIIDAVRAADSAAVIHNTRTMGKPDMVALTYKLYVESEAEAVVVISNPALTKQVVYGMESRGAPAFGPIWDS